MPVSSAAGFVGGEIPPGVDPNTPIAAQVVLWFLEVDPTPNPLTDLSNMGEMMAIMDADFDLDYSGFGGPDSKTMYRMREGIERFMITDINNPAGSAQAQSDIALMWDSIATVPSNFNHIPGGSNVLYMDGHVKFSRYPSEEMPVNVLFALVGQVTSE